MFWVFAGHSKIHVLNLELLANAVFNPLLPTRHYSGASYFPPLFSCAATNHPICGSNLETPRVVLLSTRLSMLLAMERDGVIGDKVDSCESVVVTSYHNQRRCIRLSNKCTI